MKLGEWKPNTDTHCCAKCDHMVLGYCVIFKDAIPISFMRTENDCEHFARSRPWVS